MMPRRMSVLRLGLMGGCTARCVFPRTVLLFLTSLVLSCDHPVHTQDPSLEGDWIIDSLDTGYPELQMLGTAAGGRVEIAGSTFTFYGERRLIVSFVVGPEIFPRRITFHEEGREKAKGIYVIEDQKLVICMGESEFPTQFKAVKGECGLMVLKRP